MGPIGHSTTRRGTGEADGLTTPSFAPFASTASDGPERWEDAMPVRPVEYHPFQYPRKYRPLGYGAWEPPAAPAPEPASPRRRRRTVALILAALLATIVIHVGIAAAYVDGGGGPAKTVVAQPESTAPAAAACNQPSLYNDPEFIDAGEDSPTAGALTPDVAAGLRARL